MSTQLLKYAMVIAMAVSLAACGTVTHRTLTLNGTPAAATPPAAVTSADQIHGPHSTYDYKVEIYPGLGKNFNPNPKLTLEEYNELAQLDWYCTVETDKIRGRIKEMFKQGATYGAFEGILGTWGYRLGFGSAIQPHAYLLGLGLTALGGGLGTGSITFDETLSVVHGYCMTGMVYKADEIDGKLLRVFIVPLYTGHAPLPPVSSQEAPKHDHVRRRPPPLPPNMAG